VTEETGEEGSDIEEDEGYDVDWYGVDLSLGAGVAEGFEDGGLEGYD